MQTATEQVRDALAVRTSGFPLIGEVQQPRIRLDPSMVKARGICDVAERQASAMAARMGTADRASILQLELGMLAAQVANLCGQLKAFDPTYSTGLSYVDVTLAELDCDVTVGFEYEAAEAAIYDVDHPGCGPGCEASVTVAEVWLNGADIATALMQSCIDQLTQAVWDKQADQLNDARESDAADRYEDERRDREFF